MRGDGPESNHTIYNYTAWFRIALSYTLVHDRCSYRCITVFPKLPPKLRNRICVFAANEKLHIWTDFKRCRQLGLLDASSERSKPALPSLLHTNSSRT